MTETGIYVLSTKDKEAEKLFADSPECWRFDRTDRPNTEMLSESDFILRCILEFIERVKKSREKSGHPSSVVFDDVLRRIDVGIDLSKTKSFKDYISVYYCYSHYLWRLPSQ